MKYLIMMHGLPCSGKSTLAKTIQKKLEEHHLKAEVPTTAAKRFAKEKADFSPNSVDERIPQTRESKDASYRAIIVHAEENLKKGIIPVLDASFHKQYRRAWVYGFCKEQNIPFIIISLSLSDKEVAKNVLKERAKSPDSKATVVIGTEHFQLMHDQADPISDEEKKQYSIISFNRITKEIEKINLQKDRITDIILSLFS